MRGLLIKNLCLSLCLLILVSCQHVVIPNVRGCAVAGTLDVGADCAYSNEKDRIDEMGYQQFIEFLEAHDAYIGPNGKTVPAKGAAICLSSEDFVRIKIALEKACVYLGKRCTKEMKTKLDDMGSLVNKLGNLK